MLAVPSMRHRIGSLSGEIDADKGGRMTMWLKVAPAIHKEYPWLGIGWRALTNEMMVSVAPNVERNRNHLHSNIAEILVETGIIGFTIYVIWMLLALWNAVHFA
jgi:O-antigen ligase